MQDGLKKAFMKGVCQLNFEAMNILHPDQFGQVQSTLENEIDKQIAAQMQGDTQSEHARYVQSEMNFTPMRHQEPMSSASSVIEE